MRSPKNTATTPARSGFVRGRLVGAAAIALAASVAIQNAMVVGVDAPAYGDPIEEVLAWHAQNRVAVAIAVGLEALNLPLLLGFVTGLHGLVGRRGGAGADWSRLAVAAGATLSAVMAFYSVLWIGVVLSAGELTEPSPAFELAWQMHAAAFAWSLPALGTTFSARLRRPSGLPRLGSARWPGGREPAARRRGASPRDADGSAPARGAARLLRPARVAACDRRRLVRARQPTVLTTRPNGAPTFVGRSFASAVEPPRDTLERGYGRNLCSGDVPVSSDSHDREPLPAMCLGDHPAESRNLDELSYSNAHLGERIGGAPACIHIPL
jgi:hypothetical protein